MIDLPSIDDRGDSPVGRRRRILGSKKAQVAIMGAAGVGAAAFLYLSISSGANEKPPVKPIDIGTTAIAQFTASPPVPPLVADPPAPPPPVVVQQAPAAQTVVQQTPTLVAGAAAEPVDFVRFPTSGGSAYFDVPAPAAPDLAKAEGALQQRVAGADGSAGTQVDFKPSTIAGAKAGKAIDLTYVMMPQHIPCALDTAMDSTLAGSIECHTTVDVLSPNHLLLMPAKTLIMGTYKNDVRNGQNRLFAFAGNAITKEGIPVPLDSAVSDGIGRAGVEGDVDNHYPSRFGAGVALELAEGLMGIGQAVVSKGGNSYVNLNSGSGASGLATTILQSQINQPPTVTVPPGTIISIVVDHPISFADAIRVTTR